MKVCVEGTIRSPLASEQEMVALLPGGRRWLRGRLLLRSERQEEEEEEEEERDTRRTIRGITDTNTKEC